MAAGELVDDDADGRGGRRAPGPARRRAQGFLLDGYPRTPAQAETLDGMLRRAGRRRSTPSSSSRAGGRCWCAAPLGPASAADDREEVVRERLRVYREKTEPLVDYYGGAGCSRRSTATGRRWATVDVAASSRRLGRAGVMVLKTAGELELMDEANRIVHRVLDGLGDDDRARA